MLRSWEINDYSNIEGMWMHFGCWSRWAQFQCFQQIFSHLWALDINSSRGLLTAALPGKPAQKHVIRVKMTHSYQPMWDWWHVWWSHWGSNACTRCDLLSVTDLWIHWLAGWPMFCVRSSHLPIQPTLHPRSNSLTAILHERIPWVSNGLNGFRTLLNLKFGKCSRIFVHSLIDQFPFGPNYRQAISKNNELSRTASSWSSQSCGPVGITRHFLELVSCSHNCDATSWIVVLIVSSVIDDIGQRKWQAKY